MVGNGLNPRLNHPRLNHPRLNHPTLNHPTLNPRPSPRSNYLLLYSARALRGFGDGFATIVLPVYLAKIGFDPAQIGLIAATALVHRRIVVTRNRADFEPMAVPVLNPWE